MELREPDTARHHTTTTGKTNTDGGSFVCPECAGALANGQGVLDCRSCYWTGLR